jgi:hypothetical protein
LIGFGITFYPKNETLKEIFSFINMNKDYGFVVTIKNREDFDESIIEMI